MAASQTISIPTPSSSSTSPYTIQTLSPTILAYLQSAFSGQKPNAHQVPFFHSRPHASEASNLEVTAGKRDISDFCTYMTSAESNVAGPFPRTDLTWPMSNYFINSSHNTYLTGNQLYSESSTDAYTNVCDVYDGVIPCCTRSRFEAPELTNHIRFCCVVAVVSKSMFGMESPNHPPPQTQKANPSIQKKKASLDLVCRIRYPHADRRAFNHRTKSHHIQFLSVKMSF